MSLEIYIGPRDTVDSDDLQDCDHRQFGTARGVAEFGRWVETLDPTENPEIHHFISRGWVANIGRLKDQVERGLRDSPPRPNVKRTARHLIEMFTGRPEDYVAIIGDAG